MMKHFFHLFRHELRMQLITPATYIAATVFLLLMIIVYALNLNAASKSLQNLSLSEMFYQSFSIPVLFIVPLLTMKSIADERRLGTLESLMTTPASAFEVVLSKFFGAYTFYIILWGITLSFPYFVRSAISSNNEMMTYILDHRTMLGSFIFIAVSGALYVSIGIFTSCLTRSQLVAGMLSFLILFFVLITSFLVIRLPIFDLNVLTMVEEPLDYIRAFKHLEDFSRGILDTRPFFLYLSTTLMFLGITSLMVEAKV